MWLCSLIACPSVSVCLFVCLSLPLFLISLSLFHTLTASTFFMSCRSCFVIPFRLAFRESWRDETLNSVWDALDYIGDVLFICDIYFNFRCAVMVDGIEMHSLKIIG